MNNFDLVHGHFVGSPDRYLTNSWIRTDLTSCHHTILLLALALALTLASWLLASVNLEFLDGEGSITLEIMSNGIRACGPTQSKKTPRVEIKIARNMLGLNCKTSSPKWSKWLVWAPCKWLKWLNNWVINPFATAALFSGWERKEKQQLTCVNEVARCKNAMDLHQASSPLISYQPARDTIFLYSYIIILGYYARRWLRLKILASSILEPIHVQRRTNGPITIQIFSTEVAEFSDGSCGLVLNKHVLVI